MVLAAVLTSCSSGSDGHQAEVTTPKASDRLAPAIAKLATKAGKGRPDQVRVTPPEAGSRTRAFLATDGDELTKLLDALAPVAATPNPTRRACRTSARSLKALGTPADLLALGGRVADGPSREIVQNLVTAGADALAACGRAEARARTPELAFAWSLWFRRLQVLGQ